MNKQQTINYLTELMAAIAAAHYKGRNTGSLRVHENGEAGISIDLYNFEGDGLPVCDGLKPCIINFDDGSTAIGNVFCMCYEPDDLTPLAFLCSFDEVGDVELDPEDLPETSIDNIVNWFERKMQQLQNELKNNDVTSYFFYMWNAWCEKECRRAFAGGDWKHFWNKWLGICNTYGTKGAAERFYAELSNYNRDLLVSRATEVYDRNCEKE